MAARNLVFNGEKNENNVLESYHIAKLSSYSSWRKNSRNRQQIPWPKTTTAYCLPCNLFLFTSCTDVISIFRNCCLSSSYSASFSAEYRKSSLRNWMPSWLVLGWVTVPRYTILVFPRPVWSGSPSLGRHSECWWWPWLLLGRHVRKTRICDCRIFGTLVHFSHILAKCAYRIFFPHILAFSAALDTLCSYFSSFRIFPIFGFADNQYSLLSEHGERWCRRFVVASWRSCCFQLGLYMYFPGFDTVSYTHLTLPTNREV